MEIEKVIRRNKRRAAVQTALSLPKTLLFNLRCFPLKTALKLPVLVSYKTKVKEVHKGSIILPDGFRRFGIKIGIGSNEKIPEQKSMLFLQEGHVTFKGTAKFSAGAIIANEGELIIGDGIFTNNNPTIWCTDRIEIGDDNLWGWNIFLRDGDGHPLIINGEERPTKEPIHIGNHCWIASEVSCLKGTSIPSGCVVGYGSTVTRKYEKENALIVGSPAKVVREDIGWSR